jgi:transcriptional regulator with XRE-family HTH domain
MKKTNRKASDDILQILARNTRYFRFKHGWSQKELAGASGFAETYINSIERAKVNITLANLEVLAIGLSVTEYDLLEKKTIERDLRAHSTKGSVLSKAALEYFERMMANAIFLTSSLSPQPVTKPMKTATQHI